MKMKFLAILLGLVIILAGCGSSSDDADVSVVDENGSTSIDLQVLSDELTPTGTELTSEEINGLVFMREEEKLARDVYLTLYNQWAVSIFKNISDSEQTHTDAIAILLNQYGIVDPSSSTDVGEFTDATLQNLYNQQVASGSQSLSDALKVGAAIEEIDILDISKYISQTDVADIVLVYENLMKGSRNHLRSFVSTLQSLTGEAYEPQYLSQDEYDSIISSSIERGGNN